MQNKNRLAHGLVFQLSENCFRGMVYCLCSHTTFQAVNLGLRVCAWERQSLVEGMELSIALHGNCLDIEMSPHITSILPRIRTIGWSQRMWKMANEV